MNRLTLFSFLVLTYVSALLPMALASETIIVIDKDRDGSMTTLLVDSVRFGKSKNGRMQAGGMFELINPAGARDQHFYAVLGCTDGYGRIAPMDADMRPDGNEMRWTKDGPLITDKMAHQVCAVAFEKMRKLIEKETRGGAR